MTFNTSNSFCFFRQHKLAASKANATIEIRNAKVINNWTATKKPKIKYYTEPNINMQFIPRTISTFIK